jgi:D-hydroxyproline dehydrogenase subunit gamma
LRQLVADKSWGTNQVPAVGGDRGQFHRIEGPQRRRVRCTLDGELVDAFEGESLLTLLMLRGRHVRRFEFSNEQRGGFCLIGTCQDCWVYAANGSPLRACTTRIETEMQIRTVANDGA